MQCEILLLERELAICTTDFLVLFYLPDCIEPKLCLICSSHYRALMIRLFALSMAEVSSDAR